MHNLLRYYRQNRMKVCIIIFAVIFAFAILKVIQMQAEETKEKRIKEQEETTDNVVSYQNESETIISKGNVSETYKDDFGEIIDEFYTFCINHEPEKAYELLAPDTKKVLYPTQKEFESLYYQDKFEGNKQYSFQSWSKSSNDIYIYKVKIFDNMLESGKKNDQYIEDYITIVPYKDNYLLNINGYIGREQINKKGEIEPITATISVCDNYMEYQNYTIRLKNNTDQTIILDTKQKSKSMYVTDDKNNKFEPIIYENAEDDFILEPQEAKTIQIKFNVAYRQNLNITSVNFTDIVKEGDENETYSLKIER